MLTDDPYVYVFVTLKSGQSIDGKLRRSRLEMVYDTLAATDGRGYMFTLTDGRSTTQVDSKEIAAIQRGTKR